MPLDADIAAASAADLEKIKAQDYRNALQSQTADRAVFRALARDFLDWFRSEYAKLPPDDMRHAITLAIADKYMTTSTATDPALILADAQRDAARLKAAVDEVLKTLP